MKRVAPVAAFFTGLVVIAGLVVGLPSTATAEPATPSATGTVQELSDIQSKRWVPTEMYVAEVLFVNSTGETLHLESNLSDLETGKWHSAPPATVAPGQLVKIQSKDDRLASSYGHQMQFGYRSADRKKWITYRIENKPFQKNKHVVFSRGVHAGAVDGWNNPWVPGTKRAARVDSDVIAPSNWAVVALEAASTETGAGAGLPRGEWSNHICDYYKDQITSAGWSSGRWKDYWKDGGFGALAGGYIGWFWKKC